MDPELQALLRQQQLEMTALFDRFVAANPTLQIEVEGADYWSEEEEAEYAELTAVLKATHKAQREALAATEL